MGHLDQLHDLNQHCNDCKHQLILKVYTSSRKPGLIKELDENNCHNVCLAFADEGIAEIGPFNSIGCECFERQSEKFTKRKEDTRIRIETDFL